MCYTLQAFYKVLLAVCLTFTAGGNDDNFSFLFPPKFYFERKKVADKTTTDLKGQKIRTNQNTLIAFLPRTDLISEYEVVRV